LRARGFQTPILFLTAKDATENKVEALRAGGDDYVTKPFSLAEIVARVQAILRRTGGDLPGDVLSFADIVLDEARHEVFRGETAIALTATEFSLLRYFLLNPRRVLSRGRSCRTSGATTSVGTRTSSRRTSATCGRSSTRSARS
jgi:two-component system OmpR family response regulator